jgi:hypothetical protein
MNRRRINRGSMKLLDQRKQSQLQWLQDPREINWDFLNNIESGISGIFVKQN